MLQLTILFWNVRPAAAIRSVTCRSYREIEAIIMAPPSTAEMSAAALKCDMQGGVDGVKAAINYLKMSAS
jgi:hypothetical protein